MSTTKGPELYRGDSALVFHGPPTNGFWLDSLQIDDGWLNSIFAAILEREANPPLLVRQWQEQTGCYETDSVVEWSRDDAYRLLDSLAELPQFPDLHTECVANMLLDFIRERLKAMKTLYVERI